MNAKVLRLLSIMLLGAAAPAIAAPAADVTILSQPVAVTARPDSQPGDPREFFPFTLTVSRGAGTFTYKTIIVAVPSQEEAIEVLKRTIGWKDGYLFVRQECGGGNMWRCDVDQIFALRSDRLVRIGEEAGGSRSQGPGAFFRGGYFVDMYDRLETNDLTTHAGAPSFAIYMKERNGALVVDLARTWKEGRAAYKKNRKEITVVGRDPALDPRARAETLASLLLHNAALARYCQRSAEFDETMRDARSLLPSARWETFAALVQRITPGELPAPYRA